MVCREEERAVHLGRLFQHVKLASLSATSLLRLQADQVIQAGGWIDPGGRGQPGRWVELTPAEWVTQAVE